MCIFFHVILVMLSAFYVKIPDKFILGKIINFYAKASGADSSYGFFAPAIGGKSRIVFDIISADNKKIINLSPIKQSDREAEIRLGGISDEFISEEAQDENFRKPLSSSMALAMFSKYPEAREVILHVQEYWPKTMKAYELGERASWEDYYSARFLKN